MTFGEIKNGNIYQVIDTFNWLINCFSSFETVYFNNLNLITKIIHAVTLSILVKFSTTDI